MDADVKTILEQNGLGQYAYRFEEEEIDYEAFNLLETSDIQELRLKIGPKKKLQALIIKHHAEQNNKASLTLSPKNNEMLLQSLLVCEEKGNKLEEVEAALSEMKLAMQEKVNKLEEAEAAMSEMRSTVKEKSKELEEAKASNILLRSLQEQSNEMYNELAEKMKSDQMKDVLKSPVAVGWDANSDNNSEQNVSCAPSLCVPSPNAPCLATPSLSAPSLAAPQLSVDGPNVLKTWLEKNKLGQYYGEFQQRGYDMEKLKKYIGQAQADTETELRLTTFMSKVAHRRMFFVQLNKLEK